MAPSELTLDEIRTDVTTEEVVRGFVPTPRFARVSFEGFRPDPKQPSQQAAVERVRDWTGQIVWEAEKDQRPGARLRALFQRAPTRVRAGSPSPAEAPALYLDGDFGVGKTHLLAAAYHVAPAPKAYLSFAELSYLIGAMGMNRCVEAFAGYRLICIDEFELDDVANTRLAANFLRRLLNGGKGWGQVPTRILTTSNTLPTELGKGRFAADDFKREIGEIASAFEVIRIEGDDFRRRDRGGGAGAASPQMGLSAGELRRAYARWEPGEKAKLFTTFEELKRRLRGIHPIRFARLVEPLEAVFIEGLEPIEDQEMALRIVHFVDKVYDQNVRLAFSAAYELPDLFSPEYRDKGYKKKYRRCLSRIHELAVEWETIGAGRRTA